MFPDTGIQDGYPHTSPIIAISPGQRCLDGIQDVILAMAKRGYRLHLSLETLFPLSKTTVYRLERID